ncbi:MAG: undecaprenyl-diphosphatase UppP [Saprospiraceae bacterium]|nr:undecaprenyl-diphosphatase UppP [Saprospiraceae bacterium]
MSEILSAIILGIVQGLTEFLPVSSSGHLEIVKFILGDDALPSESLLMTVLLHFGTALATVVVFRKDILSIIQGLFKKDGKEEKAFIGKIILSMIPAAFVGLLFEKELEMFFSQNILLVCCMLLVTAVLLLFADKAKTSTGGVKYKDALIIGIAQAIAILPGISRSGATVSTSVLLGIDRSKAARFSFLMVVPLIFGKMAKDVLDGDFVSNGLNPLALGLGFISAFISGYFACTWMISLVKNSQLKYFAYYCFIIGIFGIIYVLSR